MFPTQIIVGNELERKEHKWLKLLTCGLEKQEIRELLTNIGTLSKTHEKEYADAVLEAVTRANWQTIEELRGEEGMCQALLELMEPEINKIVDSAVKSTRDFMVSEMEAAVKSTRDSMASEMEAAVKSTRDSMASEMEEKNKESILRAIKSYEEFKFDPVMMQKLLMKTYELSSGEADYYLSLSKKT